MSHQECIESFENAVNGVNYYVNERKTSQITGLAVQTLRNHRHLRIGIPYVRASKRAIRYSLADIRKYMESRRISTDSE